MPRGGGRGGRNAPKSTVDKVFFRRFKEILALCCKDERGLRIKEISYIIALGALMLARTWLSVVIAGIAGTNAQMLVSRKWALLLQGILKFMAVTVPAALVNSGLKYFSAVLTLAFRVRISSVVHNEYLRGVNFYRAVNLHQIDNPDQRVTADISQFAEAVTTLYTESFKPILDVLLFTYQLNRILGWQGPTIMYAYFGVSAFIKRKIMPSFGAFVKKESELEGNYRTAHNRIITNAEEIAFYNGAAKERSIVLELLDSINQHVADFRRKRWGVGVFDGLIVKYWASLAGYFVVASPHWLKLPMAMRKSVAENTHDYILNAQFLTGLSQAVGQLVLVGNKLATISGHTARVWELLEKIRELKARGLQPFEVKPEEAAHDEYHTVTGLHQFLAEWKDRIDKLKERMGRTTQEFRGSADGGVVRDGADAITFEGVDIVAPDGQLLVKDLTGVTIAPGTNVMVTGPNGCGKSSLFRIIGGLWPLHCGEMNKPSREDVVFVPQKPYLVRGTLRDQIIYPHSVQDMKQRQVTDEELGKLLQAADPHETIRGTWEWDHFADWTTAFSGGQKQRVAMARLFYHKPRFAILDECTSCVSDEVEDSIYETCRDLGITIFTVSHRPSLQRHHNYLLHFDGRGSWSFTAIDQ
eukprot:TRINITY_DN70227_c0_g1_i1.p1 TRINITY_DN70227_c0_g1~~TRINITY_DN70227_c0_g1_i1.p1  ORF type:complete len:641 (-),score=66.41 TRINITY_DN70227_c0_g1_i1:125-2047(-)